MKGKARRHWILLLLFTVHWIGCAEVGTPPGGPIDRTPPVLLEATPRDGAREVPVGNRITLVFSERIVKPVTGNPVFVAPRPEIPPQVDWKADRIVITLADSFQANQTYLVSVAPTVGDLRGNKLDSTIAVAFTTGLTLDSGRISGHVMQNNKGVAAAMVGLFDPQVLLDTAALDSLVPEYVGLTNSEGYFSFGYLRPDSFLLLGWKDLNRDESLNPTREQYAVPDRPVKVTDESSVVSNLVLPLNESAVPLPWRDTARTGIISALYSENRLVRVRLTRSVPLSLLSRQPGNALLLPADDTLAVIPSQGLFEAGEHHGANLTLYFGDLEAGAYHLRITYDPERSTLRLDSLKVETREDNTPPKVDNVLPSAPTVFLREATMGMTFSEPLRQGSITSETFALWQNDSMPVPIAHMWLDPFRLRFTAQLAPGQRYRLDAAAFDLVDLSGNVLGDSLTSYRFAVFDADSLGSISGQIAINVEHRKGDPAVLRFDMVGRRESYTLTAPGRTYRIDLPAGKYLLSAFLDSNLDGDLTDGRLAPFEYSETRVQLSDTIAVRARFETAGADITFE